jgi:hypothetical protein
VLFLSYQTLWTLTRTANTKRHHERLHKPTENAVVSTTTEVGSERRDILKMISVQIRGPKATAIVVAFIDDGSNTTLLDSGLNRFEWRTNVVTGHSKTLKVTAEISKNFESQPVYTIENIRTMENLELPVQHINTKQLSTHLCNKQI